MDTVRFRYVGDEPRSVSILPAGTVRRLDPDQLFAVPAEHWASYACQPHLFAPLDEDPERQGMDQVLDDVGDDPAAAAQALDAERRSLKPRRRLIAELERRATAPPASFDPLADVTREGDEVAQPAPADPGGESDPAPGSTDNALEATPTGK